MNQGIRPVIIRYEDGHMTRGYIDLLNVEKEERDGLEIYSYTVTAHRPDDGGAA